MNSALARFSRRHNRLRPLRTLLTLLSVVIGVAAITSVDMLSHSIRNANQRMFATVNGASALDISGTGNALLEEQLVGQIEQVPGVQAAVPVLFRPAALFTGPREENKKTRLFVMGVDPLRDEKMRDHKVIEGRFLADKKQPETPEAESDAEEKLDDVVLEESFARSLNVKVGDEVRLLGGRGLGVKFQVVGLLRTTAYARTSAGSLVFITLHKAQEIFTQGKPKVDSVQVIFADKADADRVTSAIEKLLPQGIEAKRPAGKTPVLEQTMFSTESGLNVSASFTLLLGSFIVFNTFLMNVSERRRQLAILRAIGTTQGQIAGMLLREGLKLGLLGSAIGFVFGWLGTQFLSQMLSTQLNVDFPVAQLTPLVAIKAIGFGLGMSLVGVLYPTWQASRLTPLEGMRSIAPEDMSQPSSLGMLLGIGIASIGAGILSLTLERRLNNDWGTVAAVLILLGVILSYSPCLEVISRVLATWLRAGWGPLSMLAQQQIMRHHLRTTLTVGVLFMAAATGLGMSFAILNAVQNIRDWYHKAIRADFFIRSLLPDFATGLSPELADELGTQLRTVKGIASLDTARFVKTKVNGVECLAAARDYPTRDDISFDMIEGNYEGLYERMFEGEVVVSSVLAQKANVKLHDRITLDTATGPQRVRVAAIVNEYAIGGLLVWMQRKTGERLLEMSGVDGYVIRAEPGQVDAVYAQLEPICREHDVMLNSYRDVRKQIDGIIAGSDFGLWVLVVVGFLVASFGVVNTLTMNVLEQTRELGMLRIVAMTRSQVRRLIVVQALLLGLLGLVPGVVFGCVIGYFMNLAATVSLAHPIAFKFHPLVVAGTFFGGLALVIIAALIPAYRASRLDVLKALHYE
jgi:putative ABC transport system permease protein